MNKKLCSVVIPTYNRLVFLTESISSALNFFKNHESIFEIIVVDDKSTDGTVDFLKERFSDEINYGLLKLILNKENKGVTYSKNIGVKAAIGTWIIFLDSDDTLIQTQLDKFFFYLEKHKKSDALFFQCIDFSERIINSINKEIVVNIEFYKNQGLDGERLPVIKRKVINDYCYNEVLRGFEGLTYLDLILNKKNIILVPFVLRKYRTINSDRLSNRKNIIKQAGLKFLGYKLYLEKLREYEISIPIKIFIKIFYYRLIMIFQNNEKF